MANAVHVHVRMYVYGYMNEGMFCMYVLYVSMLASTKCIIAYCKISASTYIYAAVCDASFNISKIDVFMYSCMYVEVHAY